MRPKLHKFDCQNLLESIELEYQDLCDALQIPFERINQHLMVQVLEALIEDTLYRTTSDRFRQPVEITKEIMRIYLENEVKLDDLDIEDIEELFVRPLLEDTRGQLSKLLTNYDKYYSKWSITTKDIFPHVLITWEGDYRIDDWHKINPVENFALVVVKKHSIRRKPLLRIITEALKEAPELLINDPQLIIIKLLSYYTGGETSELYDDIVKQVKVILEVDGKKRSREALKITRDIVKGVESIPSFSSFREDTRSCEKILSSISNSTIHFDIILKNPLTEDKEERDILLKEIYDRGYVDEDIVGKVESIRG